MVFSSIPVDLDPPNWHQQLGGDGGENLQLPSLLPHPSGGSGSEGGGGSTGLIRAGSMSERARLAKIPQPETALKCPRCDSTNTKFCYFNNYSLTQPRHFCKTCRRYWTRGGALRNVPVGGGCRRNKRSKGSNRSKSPSKAAVGPCSTNGFVSNGCSSNDIIRHNTAPPPPPPPHLPTLPPLHHLSSFNSAGIGLNYSGIQPPSTATGCGVMDFQIGSSNPGLNFIPNGFVEQLRFQQLQQFPFLANLEPQNGLYPYEGEGIVTANYVGQLRSKPIDSVVTQFATVKMEENQQQQQQVALNLSKNLLGISGNNDQFWGGNAAFTDLPGFTSSSSTNHLL